ncbi:C69 family dipeptidase [Fructilactobacillus hinvesii]|uniref:Dipeptidase n=1 Tax=Fructilactobacillus hinvesii TaxID=2940300 RepID=A0ABY5BUC3_9LACO|nr:C69 family dipeptidase [Fructilactobacillus hinvesii]USS88560.1 C69 family dipeptidase [Fructilactobacillus hinvesii]
MKHLSACTSVLVGKGASVDGSTMIARNDDTFLPLTPQRFTVVPAYHQAKKTWQSNQNGFQMTLPETGYRYLATPNADVEHAGVFAESGFNEKNVAMSATESVYGNPRALSHDPWVPNGIAEDSLQSVVLPYIDSAREGVEYLGQLIKQYGSPEGNGVLFADANDVWYMEIVTGHHWVAERIPDDCYAVVANQVAIQEVDFDDHKQFMFSDGIQEFVEKYHLNPTVDEGFNFRRIFGTCNEKDRHYNTPRVWYGQKILNPDVEQSPVSNDLPFLRKASRKITVMDVEQILSSHYNETDYDPLGNGPEALKTKFRPVSMNRTQNSHVLQFRNDAENPQWAAIMWLNFGVPAFSPYVPFFANVDHTPTTYETTPLTMDDQSAYWMYRKLSMIVESHYPQFIQMARDFKTESNQMFLTHLENTIYQARHLEEADVPAFLEKQNQSLTNEMHDRVHQFMNELMSKGLTLSKLTYDMDKNL